MAVFFPFAMGVEILPKLARLKIALQQMRRGNAQVSKN